MCVCACACASVPLVATDGVIWAPYDWLNKLYKSYVASVVSIVNGYGLLIKVHCRNKPKATPIRLLVSH